MRKNHRGQRPESDEPLSAGRVEYLEQARARVRARRLRRTALIVAVLTAVVLFTTGLVGSSVALVKDCVDTTRIALMPGPGWPQQTGVMEPTQVLPMTGGFVELGGDSCVVYSRTGTRLNSIQSGYGRPALAAGKTRFVLYNRSGNELRVESRTQNLYTKKLENKIFLCAMSDNGTLAVVTDDVSSNGGAAGVFSHHGAAAPLEHDLQRRHPAADGVLAGQPPAGGCCRHGRRRADADKPLCCHPGPGRPGQCGGARAVFLSGWAGFPVPPLLAVYDSRAILYNAAGGERARYEFGGGTLRMSRWTARAMWRCCWPPGRSVSW